MSTKTMRLPPRRVSMPNVNNSNSHKRKDRDGSFDLKPPVDSNHLLARYFAYEFLTRGTMLGQMWDPVRSQPPRAGEATPDEEAAPPTAGRAEDEGKYHRYVEVANLLKTGGAHLPGVVNPSDLARLLQM